MTNIKKSRKDKKSFFRFFIVILIIIFLIFNYFKWKPLHKVTLLMSGPILNIKEVVLKPFSNISFFFFSKQKIEKENQLLKRENLNLKIEVLSNIILKKEYNDLLFQKEEKFEDSLLAKVILKPPFSSFDNFVLGGKFDEFKIGQKIYYQNVILGEIVEIRDNIAIAKLYSASGSKIPAKLIDGNQFEVFGKGSGQYEMILPKDVEIKEGDPIIYPENEIILLGVINKITSTSDDLFKKALFNIPIDFKDINYVSIENSPIDSQ